MKLNGLHHVTALASDPNRNYDFYTGALGLRLVKKTVNFDSPDIYHLYFADYQGNPGTVITFFPFPNAKRGLKGIGEVHSIYFKIPKGSFDFWKNHLFHYNIAYNAAVNAFDEYEIILLDPDGLKIHLIETADFSDTLANNTDYFTKDVSIKGFYGFSAYPNGVIRNKEFLIDLLGAEQVEDKANIARLKLGKESENSAVIDLMSSPNSERAKQSAGSVHHIAWRVGSNQEQEQWKEFLREKEINTTEIVDRCYFTSIYFRGPGGILHEIATDKPGFSIDEDTETLGRKLTLPPWMEEKRSYIESKLPPVNF
jgi:glyoxalase family protein